MITTKRAAYSDLEIPAEWQGLSTDLKPLLNVYNGDNFQDIDTGDLWFYDEQNEHWINKDKGIWVPPSPPPPLEIPLVWQEGEIPATDTPYKIRDVAYSPTLKMFVGICNKLGDNRAIYSTDGVKWSITEIPPLSAERYRQVLWVDGKFIAIGEQIATAFSVDGINWTKGSDLPLQAPWTEGVYENGIILLATVNRTETLYSTDNGNSWQQGTYPKLDSGPTANHLGAGGGKLFAWDEYSNDIGYSTDAINWTVVKLPITSYSMKWFALAYGNGVYLLVPGGTNVNTYLYSTDGITWDIKNIEPGCRYECVYGGGIFVWAGRGLASATAIQGAYSYDGLEWIIDDSFPVINTTWSLAYGQDKFVLVPYQSNQTFHAP